MVALDYAVLASYLLVVAAIGFAASRRRQDADDYFLAGRRIPWWAAGLSILATETSALTFIGAPSQSLRGDWTYLQLAIGSVLARFLVAGLLIGAYYRANVITVYGWLEQRFGAATRDVASWLFMLGRILGSGVRLYGAAIALVVAADIDFPLAIALIAVVAMAYTLVGGIRAVIWTDVLQGTLFVGAALAALVYLVVEAGGDVGAIHASLLEAQSASDASKLRVFDFSVNPRIAYTFWAAIFGSTFLTMATHGTDQDMIQRALTCRGEQGGRRSLWLSAALTFPVVAIFLAIGSLLWLRLGDAGAQETAAALAARAGHADPSKGYDFIFPFYVVQTFPVGLRGLVIAGIFAAAMSSLDSAISALSATAVTCVWRPYFGRHGGPRTEMRLSRLLSFVFAALLTAVAVITWRSEGAGGAREGFGVLMLGLKVLSWVFPPILGIFLVGVLTVRGSDRGNVIAVLAGIGVLLGVELVPPLFGFEAPFAWTWNALVGCTISFCISAAFRRPAGARAA